MNSNGLETCQTVCKGLLNSSIWWM